LMISMVTGSKVLPNAAKANSGGRETLGSYPRLNS